MRKRITHVVTRTGDTGETSLANGTRVRKDSPEIDALGNIDELNSLLGLVITEDVPKRMQEELVVIQNRLFSLGAELFPVKKGFSPFIDTEQIRHIEKLIMLANEELKPLEEFILPGGSRLAALFHLARSVCRRAERSVVTLSRKEKVPSLAIQYLNRLSDLFFVYARLANKLANQQEIYWKK